MGILGEVGALWLAVAHGLVRPGLFCLLGGRLYGYRHRRVIRNYGGLTMLMPV